ncbi:MAG: hypothetical protein JEZ05_10035 [Tenericutes bacterium]|nr:hypothetical protein [Mycoplasmatota bacterium]
MSYFFIAVHNEQLKSLICAEDEYKNLVLKEIKLKKKKLDLSRTKLKNTLLTSHNIDSKIKHYKQQLKDFKKPIERLDEFPFKDFFFKILVHSRNNIEFVLNPFDTESKETIYCFPEIVTQYTIRKTPYESISKISCL